MRLFELTEAGNPEANKQLQLAIKNLMDHYTQKVAPVKKQVDEMYAEQYLPPIVDKYKRAVKPIIKTVQYLNNAVVKQQAEIDPMIAQQFASAKTQLIKSMRIRPQSIHNRAAIANLGVQYKGKNGPMGDANDILDFAEEFNRYIKDQFALSSKISTNPIDTGKSTKQTTQPTPAKPKPTTGTALEPTVIPLDNKMDQAIDGEVVSQAEKERADKMLNKGQVVDGEWSEIDDAMKQLPERPKLLVDKNPRIGDYIMWKGGKGSSREGQMNYGEIIEPSPYIDTNKSVMYRSINSQPNKSRQGFAKSNINKDKVLKYLKKEDLAKIMPQSDPIKYTKDPKVSATVGKVGNAIQKGIKAGQRLGKSQPQTDPNAGLVRGAKGRFAKGNQSGYKYVPKTPIS